MPTATTANDVTTNVTKFLRDAISETRQALQNVLDAAGNIDLDARPFGTDPRAAVVDAATSTKKVATSTFNKAKDFVADSKAAHYVSEAVDELDDLAGNARGAAIDAVSSAKSNVIKASRRGLEEVRKASDWVSDATSADDVIAELKATIAELSKAVNRLAPKPAAKRTAKPATKRTAKPAAKRTAKPAAKPTAKSAR